MSGSNTNHVSFKSPTVATSTVNSLDELIHEVYQSLVETILRERMCVYHITNSNNNGSRDSSQPTQPNNKDYIDWYKHSLQFLKNDIYRPFVLDIYILDKSYNKYVLLERWEIHYLQNNNNDARTHPHHNSISPLRGDNPNSYASTSHRMLTLLRSIHCFIRLLPGFNLINTHNKMSTFTFQIYEKKSNIPSSFSRELHEYRFPSISTSQGGLNVRVHYLPADVVAVSCNDGTVAVTVDYKLVRLRWLWCWHYCLRYSNDITWYDMTWYDLI